MNIATQSIIPQLWSKAKQQARIAQRTAKIRFRDPEQGGWVHDTPLSSFISPSQCQYTIGTWTDTVSPSTALVYMKRRTAGAATNQLVIPLNSPVIAQTNKGAYLLSVDLWWEETVVALTTLTALLSQVVLPLDTAVFPAPTAPAFTYDALNTSNALRVVTGKRTMNLQVTSPFWVAANTPTWVDLTLVAAATSQFDFYGARANYLFRI